MACTSVSQWRAGGYECVALISRIPYLDLTPKLRRICPTPRESDFSGDISGGVSGDVSALCPARLPAYGCFFVLLLSYLLPSILGIWVRRDSMIEIATVNIKLVLFMGHGLHEL